MKLAKMPYSSEILVPLVGCSPTRASALPANQETTRLAFPPPQCFRLLVLALVVWAVVWGTRLSAVAQEAPASSDDVVLMWQGEPFLCSPAAHGRDEAESDQLHAQEAPAGSDDVVLMWQGEPFLCSPATHGRDEAESDQLHEAQPADLTEPIPTFHTGCPPDAPLCACVLQGSTLCQDPDGDGLVSLYDNCDYAANPGQENCDGDYVGDACDSNNVNITYRTEPADTGAVPTGRTTCLYDPAVHSIFFGEVQWTTGTRTIETRQYCGPSGYGTESQVVSEELDTHS